jgi:hypothetical protein
MIVRFKMALLVFIGRPGDVWEFWKNANLEQMDGQCKYLKG